MLRLMTSESVTEGHPDKLCDQISDAILDDLLSQDPQSHVAVETCAAKGQFVVFGEITSRGYSDISQIVHRVVNNVGYTGSQVGLDANSCGVMVALTSQSSEIDQGVSRNPSQVDSSDPYAAQGAGDQGTVYGYACTQTESYMPLPIALAHQLAWRLAQVRKTGEVPHLRPDGKTQVTIAYNDEGPVRVDTILISSQHDPEVDQAWLTNQLRAHVIEPVLHDMLKDDVQHDDYRLLVNPTGSFVLGGPAADSGLTGRKIIVDTYGGAAHHGGGAFSGKDPSKVDRSAAYAARWVAKNLVAAGIAQTVEVQISYAIGVADPVSIDVEPFGTLQSGLTRDAVNAAVREVFDLRPAAIIDALGLLKPIYERTAAYGHFGRTDVDFPWEECNKVEDLRKFLGL